MYESKRVTISFPAIERLNQVYGLPNDLSSQTLAGYIERLIFESLGQHSLTAVPIAQRVEVPTEIKQPSSIQPNISKLAAMAKPKN